MSFRLSVFCLCCVQDTIQRTELFIDMKTVLDILRVISLCLVSLEDSSPYQRALFAEMNAALSREPCDPPLKL